MIRRFTSAQFVPANAGAKAKNPVGSTLFSTPIIAFLRHSGHQILRTCCRESARKRLKPPALPFSPYEMRIGRPLGLHGWFKGRPLTDDCAAARRARNIPP